MMPKGTILLIGGAEDKEDGQSPDMKGDNKNFERFEILKQLLPAGGRKKRKIEIITTASSMPDEMNRTYAAAFRKIGFKEVGFMKIETKSEARNPDYTGRINAAHAVLFSGGDQFTLSAILGGTEVVKAIKKKYIEDKDFIVSGSSAGAMVMSKIMIYEGGVSEALLKGDVNMSSGLGILDNCIVDTHFVKRGRFSRLANAIIMNPEDLGVGLGEDTAMIIKKGAIAECCGSGSVTIIDGNNIGCTNIADADDKTPVFVENLRIHLLSKGCRFSFKKRRIIIPAKQKKKMKLLHT
jgi:cyanophycinase